MNLGSSFFLLKTSTERKISFKNILPISIPSLPFKLYKKMYLLNMQITRAKNNKMKYSDTKTISYFSFPAKPSILLHYAAIIICS